jgi:hypothetical protein
MCFVFFRGVISGCTVAVRAQEGHDPAELVVECHGMVLYVCGSGVWKGQVILLKNMTVSHTEQRGNQFLQFQVPLVNGQRGCVMGFERKNKEDLPRVSGARGETRCTHIYTHTHTHTHTRAHTHTHATSTTTISRPSTFPLSNPRIC